MLQEVLASIKSDKASVVAMQELLVAHPALGPENGGQGEVEKAAALKALLASYGFPEPRVLDAPDPRVSGGVRPNFAYRFEGEDSSKTLWILGHMDVVPAGDLSAWRTDPFKLTVDGDVMTGRGVEDNHQAVVSSALLGKALVATGAKPPINLGLLYLADEETGNNFGIDYVVKKHADLFGKDDLFIVPDCGAPDGLDIEVAEKGILWIKVIVEGKQCHASGPDDGINTMRAVADFIIKLETLDQKFDARDPLFSPPRSTFEPTKKEANVPSVNIIPGRDVFYIDCRVLPSYSLDDVWTELRKLGAEVEAKRGVKISYELAQRSDAAPVTLPDAEVVRRLATALAQQGCGQARIKGIGGGTFAAVLRRQGHPAAAWATILENAHQPNESAHISWTLGDAQVMARVLFG